MTVELLTVGEHPAWSVQLVELIAWVSIDDQDVRARSLRQTASPIVGPSCRCAVPGSDA